MANTSRIFAVPGVQVRAQSGMAILDMQAAAQYNQAKPMQPVMTYRQLNNAPWANWGPDNLRPKQMLKDIENTGILSGIIDGKARFALCEGMIPAIVERNQQGQRVIKSYLNDAEINEWLEMNDLFTNCFAWMKDQIALGSGAARYMLNKAKNKIAALQRDDFSELRFEKQDPATGNINSVYYSADWQRVRSQKDPMLINIPLLNKKMPLEDLRAKASAGIVEHAITFNQPGWGTPYYPKPLWLAAQKWVQIAQGVPEMKAAIFNNSISLKYMVIIYQEYWESAFPNGAWDDFQEEEKAQRQNDLYDEIEAFLVGAENSQKSIFLSGVRDKINGHSWQHIEIKPIEYKQAQGELLPESAVANSEIAFSMLFNPAIIGASMPSGPYTNSQGGSSVRESVLLQIILHELERRNLQRVMNVVKQFNGWAAKFPGLEFIIPATVLTTLDTGGSSKPVTLGANQTTDNKENTLKNAA